MEKRIQEIRELEKRATRGPWVWNARERFLAQGHTIHGGMVATCEYDWIDNAPTLYISDENIALIIAMRNNILAILDDNERLRAENAQLQREWHALQGFLLDISNIQEKENMYPKYALYDIICDVMEEWRGTQEVEHD